MLQVCKCQQQDSLFTIFSVPVSNYPLRNLVFDEEDNSIFFSGKNVLYKFDWAADNVSPLTRRVTGPRADCFGEEDLDIKYCGDNENTVLVVTPKYLITCGTLFGGRCMKRDKETLFETSPSSAFIQLVSDIDAPAVGKLLNISVNDSRENKLIILFAKMYTPLPIAPTKLSRAAIFSVSQDLQGRVFLHTLNEESIFDIFIKEETVQDSIKLDYRAILESDNFTYILVNQNKKPKLVKLCKQIDGINPKKVYEDIPLSCITGTTEFTYVVHGAIAMVSDKTYLLALFKGPNGIYGVCVYQETEILKAFLLSRIDRYACPEHDLQPEDKIFDEAYNRKKCINITSLTADNEPVSGIYEAFNEINFCNKVSNRISEFGMVIGLLPLKSTAVYTTDLPVSVIESHVFNDNMIAFIGTEDGKLVKIYLDNNLSRELLHIKVDDSKIMAIKKIHDEIYVMSKNKMYNKVGVFPRIEFLVTICKEQMSEIDSWED
ncbi:uncharacterized protein LOC133194957 [Saccostrea echinata]|uniref:uncharacterized protein LOC133194957 n=1 Tax=Saccostrea echinata TaxID=191078 RepID=UPI002A811602|nr:uncharacterized protein LOC133194957 [Saccostrea echinata]